MLNPMIGNVLLNFLCVIRSTYTFFRIFFRHNAHGSRVVKYCNRDEDNGLDGRTHPVDLVSYGCESVRFNA
jgi:hypothetical protein